MTTRARSPEAKARRRAKARERRALKAQQVKAALDAAGVDAGALCRSCWVRPHVPMHDMCRACRYYTRGDRK